MDFTGEADGKAAPVKESLARQGSIYALTLDEFQSTLGGLGKEFGSMNMDDLLKSIWTAEEGFAMAVVGCDNGSGAAGRGLPRQGSLTLPRTLSMKTVDEVWRGLIVDSNAAAPSSSGQAPTTGVVARQPTLGEMTLEEFLVRAGVVREELIATPAPTNPQVGAGLLFDEMPTAAGNYRGLALGFSQADQSGGGMVNAAIPRGSDANLGLDMGLMTGVVGLATAGVAAAKVSPPSHLGSDMLGKGNGDMSSASPVPYLFGGGMRGRKCSGSVEKVVERRQRRMIKNRESAARSRARKQAYTMELEAEVAKLKEQNEELQRKQAELIEMQKNQDLHMLNQHHGQKKPCLRRTQTGPW